MQYVAYCYGSNMARAILLCYWNLLQNGIMLPAALCRRISTRVIPARHYCGIAAGVA